MKFNQVFSQIVKISMAGWFCMILSLVCILEAMNKISGYIVSGSISHNYWGAQFSGVPALIMVVAMLVIGVILFIAGIQQKIGQ